MTAFSRHSKTCEHKNNTEEKPVVLLVIQADEASCLNPEHVPLVYGKTLANEQEQSLWTGRDKGFGP